MSPRGCQRHRRIQQTSHLNSHGGTPMPFTAAIGPLELLILLVIGIFAVVFFAARRRPAGLQVDTSTPPMKDATTKRFTSDDRNEALARAIDGAFVQGYRVESQTDIQAVMVAGKPVNRVLHLLLTLVTVGLWLFVWIALLIWGGEKRVLIRVDEYGNLSSTKI